MIPLNCSTLQFLSLLKQYLVSNGEDSSVPDFASEINLAEIMKVAVHNNCDSFIYHRIRKWGTNYGMEASVLDKYKNRLIFSAARQFRADAELGEVLRALNAAGVKFMLLKGVILSAQYPNPEYRHSCDADIHVSDEFAERAAEIFLARGYVYMPHGEIKYEKTYRLNDVLSIELHTRLFEKFYEKNRAAISEIGFDSFDSRREIKILGASVEMLSPNYFLIYVICHHTKHFIASGIKIRHLMDICVYVNKCAEQLDWEFVMSSLAKFGIKEFAVNLLYICQHYLGMTDISFLYRDIEEDVIFLLLYDIAERNAVTDGALERASVHDIVHDAYFGVNTNIAKSSFLPSVKALSNKYAYAKRNPVLLPIAWAHRACSYALRKLKGNKIISPKERAKLAADRVELLKRVKIL